MLRQAVPCPVCGFSLPQIGHCKVKDKIVAYNIYCPMCNWTGRSFKQQYKAIDKWNRQAEQCKNIVSGDKD